MLGKKLRLDDTMDIIYDITECDDDMDDIASSDWMVSDDDIDAKDSGDDHDNKQNILVC